MTDDEVRAEYKKQKARREEGITFRTHEEVFGKGLSPKEREARYGNAHKNEAKSKISKQADAVKGNMGRKETRDMLDKPGGKYIWGKK